MRRWLLAVLAALVVIAAGYVVFVNAEPQVAVRWAPERVLQVSLGVALLAAFGAGAGVVGLVAGVSAGARRWRRMRAAREARRAAAQAAITARAAELVWAGDPIQARHELERAIGATPADATRLGLLAESHLQAGEPAEARRVLEEGLAQAGSTPRLLDLMADACERGGDLGAAVSALERAREALPESPRLARRLRDLHLAAGRPAQALALQGEIMLRVREPAALDAEGETLRGLRYEAALVEPDDTRAARLLAAIGREAPGFVPAWVAAGDRLVAAGRRFAARRTWERGARATGAVVLLERLMRLYVDDGRPDRATRVLRRLAVRHPQAPGPTLVLAGHLIEQGVPDEAEQALTALPPGASDHPRALVLWAEVHRRRGNHTLAAETYARACGPGSSPGAAWRCVACRAGADAWAGWCAACGRWGTLRAGIERIGVGAAQRPAASR